MAGKNILSEKQKNIFSIISKDKLICDNFYLTGGTALAEFYLHHRLSEYLDFFLKNNLNLNSFLEKYKNFSLDDLIKKAQIKFGNYIDPIQLGSQYMKAKELKGFPKILVNINENVWQDFFTNEAKNLSGKIIK